MLNTVNNKEWAKISGKKLFHPNNKRFVTARINIINNKKVIVFSIGVDICELIEFNHHDIVNVFIHKIDRNLFIIKKENNFNVNGYKLVRKQPNSSFMTFNFRYETVEDFRLSQTIILDYDFESPGMLVVNLEKIKWRE